MFLPLSDENATLRPPVMTYGILGLIGFAWVVVQGAGQAIPLI